MKKAYEQVKKYKPIKMPYDVWRFFPKEARQIDIYGDQLSLGEDYGSLEELRGAIAWIVDQLGGKVKWDEKK